MKRVRFYEHPSWQEHNPGTGHPECADRLRAIDTGLTERGLYDKLVRTAPPQVTTGDLCRVHDSAYVESILSLRGKNVPLDGDTAVSPRSVEAALYAAGAVKAGVRAVLEKTCDIAFCPIRPPGHHAESNRAMGFCLFNNVAVGAAYALAEMNLKRVMIIDPDVHHGNGTQHIFYDRADVFYFSIHQYPFFPGTGAAEETGSREGAGHTVNVPLPPGMGDREYLYVVERLLCPLIADYRPELVLFSAGFDAHILDPLGQMDVSNEGFRAMFETVLHTLEDLAIPSVFALEGGYSLEALRSVVPDLIDLLVSGDWTAQAASEPNPAAVRTVDQVRRCLAGTQG